MKKKKQLPSLEDELFKPLDDQESRKITGGVQKYCKTMEEVVITFVPGCPSDTEVGTPESNYDCD